MKRIVTAIGILNILEGLRVWVQNIPANLFEYPIPPTIHCIFHLLVGIWFTLIGTDTSPAGKKYFRPAIIIMGSFFLFYGIGVLFTRQQAEKFGYRISYPMHAGYYLVLSFFLFLVISKKTS